MSLATIPYQRIPTLNRPIDPLVTNKEKDLFQKSPLNSQNSRSALSPTIVTPLQATATNKSDTKQLIDFAGQFLATTGYTVGIAGASLAAQGNEALVVTFAILGALENLGNRSINESQTKALQNELKSFITFVDREDYKQGTRVAEETKIGDTVFKLTGENLIQNATIFGVEVPVKQVGKALDMSLVAAGTFALASAIFQKDPMAGSMSLYLISKLGELVSSIKLVATTTTYDTTRSISPQIKSFYEAGLDTPNKLEHTPAGSIADPMPQLTSPLPKSELSRLANGITIPYPSGETKHLLSTALRATSNAIIAHVVLKNDTDQRGFITAAVILMSLDKVLEAGVAVRDLFNQIRELREQAGRVRDQLVSNTNNSQAENITLAKKQLLAPAIPDRKTMAAGISLIVASVALFSLLINAQNGKFGEGNFVPLVVAIPVCLELLSGLIRSTERHVSDVKGELEARSEVIKELSNQQQLTLEQGQIPVAKLVEMKDGKL